MKGECNRARAALLCLLLPAWAGTTVNAQVLLSDDFNACELDPTIWTLVDPIGGGSASVAGMGTESAHLLLHVPGGASHNIWTDGNQSVRVVQQMADADFEVQAKFDSPLTLGYQMHGLLVEESSTRFLRYDLVFDGSNAFLFCATFADGAAAVRRQMFVPNATPSWLSVGRAGNQWTIRFSANGTTWTDVTSFSFPMVVTHAGPFAGNYSPGPAPAYTARVDYFLNTAAPFDREDGPPAEPGTTLTRSVTGQGTIDVTPEADAYYCGETVTLRAVPAPGWLFLGWSGDLAGLETEQSLTMNVSRTVAAEFAPDGVPPEITNLEVLPGKESALIRWTTDVPARSSLRYGLTTGYELGTLTNDSYLTQHAFTLAGLAAEQTYHFHIICVDEAGDAADTGDLTFQTQGNLTGIESDDFNGCGLNAALWTFVDPLGGGAVRTSGMGTSDARLEIVVPGGASRDVWTDGNRAVRVMQSAADSDFEVAVKFESRPSQRFQMQGLFVEQAPGVLLRYDAYHNGSQMNLFSASLSGNNAVVRRDQQIQDAAPIWLSIRRAGNTWTFGYSYDGQAFLTHTTFNFAMAVSQVGIWGGNYAASGSAPGHTVLVDYFLNSEYPFDVEDGPVATPGRTLTTTTTGRGTLDIQPAEDVYYCNEQVTLHAIPEEGWLFAGWGEDLSGTETPRTVVMNQSYAISALFLPDELPPLISEIQIDAGMETALVRWKTDIPATGRVLYGTTAAYELGYAEHTQFLTDHEVVLVNLEPERLYHLKIVCTDSAGDLAETQDLTFVTTGDPAGIKSDDFNKCALDTSTWTLVDPLGGASVELTGVGTLDAYALIHVPAGASHDIWTTGNHGVALMQSCRNVDFDVEARFDSKPDTTYQIQGLVLEESATRYMRYDVFHDSGQNFLFAATFVDGTTIARGQRVVSSTDPIWFGIRRVGNQWTLEYSQDGASWSLHASFQHAMNVARIGPYAGNFSTDMAPAFTAKVDYFMNRESPFADEDGPLPTNATWLSTSVVGQGTIVTEPPVQQFYCDEVVTLTARARHGWRFIEWGGDLSGSTNPQQLSMTTSRAVVAQFEVYPSTLVSDDFNSCALNTAVWQPVDPLGGAAFVQLGTGSQDAGLRVLVPGGSVHRPTAASNNAPRVMQEANDTDFEIEVKFDSAMLLPDQLQGVVIEQSPTAYLTFDLRHTGGAVEMVATAYAAGIETVRQTTSAPSGAPLYLKVRREGDTWFHAVSADGSVWSQADPFEQAMNVTAAGVFFGNMGSAPAFMGVVDYFFNTASPIVPEDGPPDGAPSTTLTTSVQGQGAIVVDPPQETFYCSETITLTATPALGWMLEHWVGDLDGAEPTRTLSMAESRSVEAVFILDERPIVISNVVATPDENSATITFQTNKPVRAAVGYGLTTSHELGILQNSEYLTEHVFEITGLSSYTRYYFMLQCIDARAAEAYSPQFHFVTTVPGRFYSDDFNAFNLNPDVWTIVDPLQDATFRLLGTNTPDARLHITIPANIAHAFTPEAINVPRIMQNVEDRDFVAEAKFESILNRRFQMNGLLVEADDGRYLRIEFYSSGTGTFFFVAGVENGVTTILRNQSVINSVLNHLRVTRTEDNWNVEYSYNGMVWIPGITFQYPMTVARLGPYAGTDGTPAPPFTAMIDYVFNMAVPISPEDGDRNVVDTRPPNLFSIRSEVREVAVDLLWSTDEPATSMVEYGQTLSYEGGVVSAPQWVTSHLLTVVGLEPLTPYNFRISSQDAAGNVRQSENIVVTTDEINYGPVIDVWYGDHQRFGHVGTPQPMVNILGNVSDDDGVVLLTYSLNGGPPYPLNIGPNTRRLFEPGDFNVDLEFGELLPGLNQIVLGAMDGAGRMSEATLTVSNEQGPIWPLPCTVEWAGVTNVNEVAQAVDGRWVVEGDTVRALDVAYDRLLAIGDVTWQDYEVTVPITVRSMDPAGHAAPSFGPGVGLVLRWPGHSDDGMQPVEGVYPLGAIGMFRWTTSYERFELFGNEGSTLAASPASDRLLFGVDYKFKMRVETLPDQEFVRYSLKYWFAEDFEPYNWNISGLQRVRDDPGHGSVLLLAHHVDASFGAVTARPGPFVDSAPVSITDVQVAPLDFHAVVTWQTSEPTTGRVKYGPTPAYESGVVADETLATLHSVLLTGLEPGTQYHYQIGVMVEDGRGLSTGNLTFTTTVGCEVDTDGDGTVDCEDGCPLDPAKTSPGMCGCGVPETACNALPDLPTGWVDTMANSSLSVDDSLFGMFSVNGQQVFGTVSTAANIHSHYAGPGCYEWTDYEFSGSMMITHANGGIGVTLFSDYPNSDSYYRLRRYTGFGFHVAPRPHGIVTMSYGTTDTGVVPAANVWYAFRLQARNVGTQTWVRARVWQEGLAEPETWQVDCVDAHGNRLTAGTVGVWSMGLGAKYWKDLSVRLLEPESSLNVQLPDVFQPAWQFPDAPVEETFEDPPSEPVPPGRSDPRLPGRQGGPR